MIPYGRQDISEADIDAVVDVLRSDFLTQGPVVPRFEQAVASYVGAQYGVATNSATSALHVACLALDLGPGDWLWTSPTTFVASANCARYCGAKVDFVDIDPRTYNLSVDRLEARLAMAEQAGCLPKVVVPVHMCGQSCEMAGIRALADRYGFRILEDASHAIGGRYRETPVGACTYSDITVFSFHPVKIITTTEGGMAVTNDPTLADLMQRYRSHGITSNPAQMRTRPANEIWNYQQIRLGFNYRMTDVQAALGLSQLERIDDFVASRHAVAVRYNEALGDAPLQLPWQHPDTYSSYHLYPILLDPARSPKTQREIFDGMVDAGVSINLHYIPVYRQPYYEGLGFAAGYCPAAENYFRHEISIPVYATLTLSEQDFVIEQLRRLLG